MAKHTPGKWQRIGENGHKIISDLPGITARVAEIDFEDTPKNEAEANAALIAAAPELLVALEALHEEIMSRFANYTDMSSPLMEIMQNADKAITAAKGE